MASRDNGCKQIEQVASKHLDQAGLDALKYFLKEPFRIEPRFCCAEDMWPVLEIFPAELFHHILSSIPKECKNSVAGPLVEVYGGVARSTVAAGESLVVNPPTDFDARFNIRSGRDGREFDRCRSVVEQFLFNKLLSMNEAARFEKSMIRNIYFQKQVSDLISFFSIIFFA